MATGGAQRGSSGTNLGIDDLFNVYNALHPVRGKYKFIGLGIGVEKSMIDTIVKKDSDPDECLLEILSFRLKQTPALTWADIIHVIRSRAISEPSLADEIEKSLEKPNEPSFNKNNEIKDSSKERMGKQKVVSSSEEGIPIGCTEECKKSSDEELSSESNTIQPQYDSPSVTKSTSKSERESAGRQSSPSSILQEQYRVKATSKALVAMKYQLSSQSIAHDGTKPRQISKRTSQRESDSAVDQSDVSFLIKAPKSRVTGEPCVAEDVEQSLDIKPSFRKKGANVNNSKGKRGKPKVVPLEEEYVPIHYTEESKKSSDEEMRSDSEYIQPQYESLFLLGSEREKHSSGERPFIMKAIRTRRLVEPRVAEDIEESLEKQEKPSTEKKYQYKEGMGKWGKGVSSSEEGIPIGCTEESKKSSDEEVSSESDTIQPQYYSPSVTKSTSQSERESAGGQSSPSSILQEQYRVKATSKDSVAMKYQLSSQSIAHDGTKPSRMLAGNEYPHHVHTELSRDREITSDEKTSSHFKEEVETEGDRHDKREMQGERGEGRGRKGKWREGMESEQFVKRPRTERESSQTDEVASSHFKGQVETEYDHHDERKMQGVGGEGTGRKERRRNGQEDIKQLQSEGLTSGKQSQMKKESRQKDVHIHLTEFTQRHQHYTDDEMKKKQVSRHRSIPHEEEEDGNELFFSCSSGEDISEGEIEKRVKSRTMHTTTKHSEEEKRRKKTVMSSGIEKQAQYRRPPAEKHKALKPKSVRSPATPHPPTAKPQSKHVQVKTKEQHSSQSPHTSRRKEEKLVTSETKKHVSPDQQDSEDEINSDGREEDSNQTLSSNESEDTAEIQEQSYNEPTTSEEEVKGKPISTDTIWPKETERTAQSKVTTVDVGVPGDDEESDPETKDQVPKKRIRRRQRESGTSAAVKGNSSPSTSQEENQEPVEQRKERSGGGVTRREKSMRSEEKNASSSPNTDDSSPESEIFRSLSDKEKRRLKKEFKCMFGRLCCEISDPVKTAAQLQSKRLISFYAMQDMLTSPESSQVKKINLVKELNRKLKIHPDKLFTLITVFISNEALHGVGNELWIQAGKICPGITADLLGSETPSIEHTTVGQTSVSENRNENQVAVNNTELQPPPPLPVSSIGTISSVPSHSQVSQSTTQSGLSQVLTEYRDYLKAYYGARLLAPADKYLPTLNSPYINLAMVSRKDSGPEDRDEFTRQTLHGGIDQILKHKTPITLEDLLSPEEASKGPVKFVLVEGPPGIGKSTFVWELCRRWDQILGGYIIVLLLKLREKWVLNVTSLPDLFRYENDPQLSKIIAKELAATHGRNLLLVLDGFDEVSHIFHEDSVIKSILCKQLLPECTIILTTRPSAMDTLLSVCQPRVDKHIEIIGFTEEERVRYIIEVFSNEPELQANFLKYMFLIPHIKSMMYIPLNCAIIAQVYYECQKSCDLTIPRTRTQLYKALTHSLLVRHMKMKVKENEYTSMLPEGLEEKEMEDFKRLAKFACDSYHRKEMKVTFFKEDIPEGLVHFGFMNESNEMYAGKGLEKTFSFLHLSLQEYLAAWHVAHNYSIEFQVAYSTKAMTGFILTRHRVTNKEEENLLESVREGEVEPAIFLAGITGMRCQSESDRNLWEEYITIDRVNCGHMLRSMYEAQNPSLPSHYYASESKRKVLINSHLTPYDSYALSYCLAHSPNTIKLIFLLSESDEATLLETFVKGYEDHCKSTSLNVDYLHVGLYFDSFEVSNKCVSWLARPKFLCQVLKLVFDCPHWCINGSLLHNFLKLFVKLETLVVQIDSSTSLEFLAALKSELKVLDITVSKECSPTQPLTLCWPEEIEFNFKEFTLNIHVPFSYYNLHSPTDGLLHSIMKSVLRSNQITKLFLPNISRETMAGVRSILLHCPSLVSLVLVRTTLGYDGILFICSALRNNTTLKKVRINDQELPIPESNKKDIQYSSMERVPLPDKTTCTDFLLELNDILKNNTTLEVMEIQSGLFHPENGEIIRSRMRGQDRQLKRLLPLQQLNFGAIASGKSPNLRRSFSSSDLTQPQNLLLFWRKYYPPILLNYISVSHERREKDKKRQCAIPSFTAPETEVLRSLSGLDARLKKCLKI